MRRAAVARVCVVALAFAGAVAMWAGPARAAAEPLTVSEFSARLGQARDLVTHPSLATTGAAASAADSLDALLPATLEVAEGTRTITVDLTQALVDVRALRSAPTAEVRAAAAKRLLTRLDAMRAAVATAYSTDDPVDPDALVRIVGALPAQSTRADDWLNNQIQKILEWFAKLFGQTGPSTTPGSALASRITMVVVLALPVLLAFIVLVRALLARRRRSGAAGTALELETVPGAPAVAAAADLPSDALGYAEGLSAAGAHRDAVRALYGGAARHLVDEGAVSRMRTRTNREMLRDVTDAAPAIAPPFESLTGDFDRAWYGHADPGAEGFAHARSSYERVVSDPATPAAAPIPDPPHDVPSGGDA